MISKLLLSAALALFPAGAFAQGQRPPLRPTVVVQQPVLKTDITATRDILTFGDLVVGLPVGVAQQQAFRAPALGETGTIQAHRVLEAVSALGVENVQDNGAAQIVVTRAARRITLPEIEAAVRRAVEERFGVDARNLALSIESGAPALVAEPELQGQLLAQDISFDQRSRRVAATMTLPGSAALRLKPARIVGQLVETVEVIVPIRTVNRGELVQAADITVERRPRDNAQGDFLTETTAVIGKAARRTLSAGAMLRAGDLQRQEIIARNEVISVVFGSPFFVPTVRFPPKGAAPQGDTINVQNINSKKIVQATVIGPGRVIVNGGSSGRVAAAN
jgi:flagellar basal body P-ring formation protein FlgA